MPYIKDHRPEYEPALKMLIEDVVYWVDDDRELPGIWNYLITELILRSTKKICGKPRYYVWAWIEGIFGHLQKEIYRRIVADYEDEAIVKNYDTKGYLEFLEEEEF